MSRSLRSFPGGWHLAVAAEALGLIETRGFIAAVEAADVMCKTARVRLVRYEVNPDGLVTIVIRGDLGEVEAAVDSGARAAGRHGERVAEHVIPSPEGQLEYPLAGPENPRSRYRINLLP
jgi:ethanolamine utilization protein EutM